MRDAKSLAYLGCDRSDTVSQKQTDRIYAAPLIHLNIYQHITYANAVCKWNIVESYILLSDNGSWLNPCLPFLNADTRCENGWWNLSTLSHFQDAPSEAPGGQSQKLLVGEIADAGRFTQQDPKQNTEIRKSSMRGAEATWAIFLRLAFL